MSNIRRGRMTEMEKRDIQSRLAHLFAQGMTKEKAFVRVATVVNRTSEAIRNLYYRELQDKMPTLHFPSDPIEQLDAAKEGFLQLQHENVRLKAELELVRDEYNQLLAIINKARAVAMATAPTKLKINHDGTVDRDDV